jgi:hypothetical protein
MLVRDVRADGFVLDRALEMHPHITLELTEAQIATIGVWRRLDLTKEQLAKLRARGIKTPKILGVETLGEPDCSCCISSAFWIEKNRILLWTDRLKTDTDGSAWYYQVRSQEGHYVFDANGNLFYRGQPVTVADFQKVAAEKPAEGTSRQVSLGPGVSPDMEAKLRKLQRKNVCFHFRL